MAVTSLLELIGRLLTDGDAAAGFRAAPDRFLSDHGLDDLTGADVIDALALGFDSVAPDLALRLVLPAGTADDASAADTLADLLDAAPAESVLEDASGDRDLDFGFGDVLDEWTFGAGDGDVDSDHAGLELDLDLDADLGSVADLDTAPFDQGFGSGSGEVGADLDDVDDLGFAADQHDDLNDGPDGLV